MDKIIISVTRQEPSDSTALDAIDQFFDEGYALLKDKMDNMMLIFRESDPEFYNGY